MDINTEHRKPSKRENVCGGSLEESSGNNAIRCYWYVMKRDQDYVGRRTIADWDRSVKEEHEGKAN